MFVFIVLFFNLFLNFIFYKIEKTLLWTIELYMEKSKAVIKKVEDIEEQNEQNDQSE